MTRLIIHVTCLITHMTCLIAQVTCLISLHKWHALLTCATWLRHMCDMTQAHMRHDSGTYATWLIYHSRAQDRQETLVRDVINQQTWHVCFHMWHAWLQASFTCVTWHSHMCDMTYSCATWLIHVLLGQNRQKTLVRDVIHQHSDGAADDMSPYHRARLRHGCHRRGEHLVLNMV